MVSIKKWISATVATVMMLALIPLAHAEGNQTEIHNLAKGLSYQWSEEPNTSYPDTGNKLTDGQYGTPNVLDPAWVGHLHGKTREVVFDLGASKSISGIKAHFLQDWPASAVLFPLTVSVYVSDDNEHWGTLTHKATEKLWVDGPPTDQSYIWDGSKDGVPNAGADATMVYARYVKVTFSMHPTAWSFIDEIEILGTDGKADGAGTVPPESFNYEESGAATAGIHNLSLLYNGYYQNGDGDWTKDKLIPEISYVNKEGNPVDWFFDGVLTLGLLSPQGADLGGGGGKLSDWKWYLDKTFAEQGDMSQLNEATKEVGAKLGQPDHKLKVVMMIPNPGEYLTDFGDVDGDGITENFNAGEIGLEAAMANREKSVRWWVDEVMRTWKEKNYSNLEIVGMYWLEEQVSTSQEGPDFLRSVNGIIHDQGLNSFWIPHSLAYKSFMWKDVGFDAVAFQPNYFFEPMNVDRIEDAANTAKQLGMGVEMEFDGRMLNDKVFRDRFMDYLNGGVQFGYMGNAFKAYYKGSGPVLADAAASGDPEIRKLYDNLYQFSKGTYSKDSTPPEIKASMNGNPLGKEGNVIQDSDTVRFSWEATDAGGVASESAVFDGKDYAKEATVDLAGKPGEHQLTVTAADEAGNSASETYVIQVTTSSKGMKSLVKRFANTGEFTNKGIATSLTVQLDAIGVLEGKGNNKAIVTLWKAFIKQLDEYKKMRLISEHAYEVLKADAEYLIIHQ